MRRPHDKLYGNTLFPHKKRICAVPHGTLPGNDPTPHRKQVCTTLRRQAPRAAHHCHAGNGFALPRHDKFRRQRSMDSLGVEAC